MTFSGNLPLFSTLFYRYSSKRFLMFAYQPKHPDLPSEMKLLVPQAMVAIVIVDADAKSRGFYTDVIDSIDVPNRIIFFNDSRKAIYLYSTGDVPFIIHWEINLLPMSDREMKETIQKDRFLQEKSISFIFISTNASAETIPKANQLNVQGYFKNP